MSPTDRREAEGLLQRSPFGALFCLALSVADLTTVGSPIVLSAVATLFAGIVMAALLLFSWRHYHPWWSWLIWVIPGSVMFGTALAVTVGSGEVSVLSAIAIIIGCGGFGFLATLFLLRVRIRRWLGA